jgi:hypothetical protein
VDLGRGGGEVTEDNRRAWASLVKRCAYYGWGEPGLSVRRKSAVIEVDDRIKYYEKELRRLRDYPEYAKIFSNDLSTFAADLLSLMGGPLTRKKS